MSQDDKRAPVSAGEEPDVPEIHLFTLRLWCEYDKEKKAWRGSIRSGAGGKVEHFIGIESIAHLIQSHLEEHSPE